MPSGPEGDQEISEHTLMHPKYKRLDVILVSSLFFFFFAFLPPSVYRKQISQTLFFCFFIFRLTQALIQVSFSLPPFCIIVIYCTCNELVSIATFNSKEFWV